MYLQSGLGIPASVYRSDKRPVPRDVIAGQPRATTVSVAVGSAGQPLAVVVEPVASEPSVVGDYAVAIAKTTICL